MAAKMKRNMVMSIRKAKFQREPAGRRCVGGIGVLDCGAAAVKDKRELKLGEGQLSGGGIVIEEFRVAAPLNSGFQLPAGFLFAEMFVEQVAKKFVRQRAVRFGFQGLLHLAKERDVGQRGFAENSLARLDVRVREFLAFRGDDGVAFLNTEQAEERSGVDGGQQGVHFKAELVSELPQVDARAEVCENFEQSRHAARARMREHDGFVRNYFAGMTTG